MLHNRSIFFSSFLTLSKLRPYQFDFQHCIVKNNFVCWYFCSDLLRNDRVSSWRNIYLSFGAINTGDIFVTNSREGKRKIVSNVIFTSRGEKSKFTSEMDWDSVWIQFRCLECWSENERTWSVFTSLKLSKNVENVSRGEEIERERALFHISHSHFNF